jgi:hypothetical protein
VPLPPRLPLISNPEQEIDMYDANAQADAEYDAWLAEQAAGCDATLVLGPARGERYGTFCALDANHSGDVHTGPHPLAEDGTISWTGGGMCAGDRLPAVIVDQSPISL